MKRTTITLLICALCISSFGQEQNWHFNFRPTSPIATSTFSKKGDIKIEASRQSYRYTPSKDSEDKALKYFLNWLMVTDNRLGVSYGLFDNISVGASYLYSHKFDDFYLTDYETQNFSELHLARVDYDIRVKTGELFAACHNTLGRFLAYEGRTGIAFGHGSQTYSNTHKIPDDSWETSDLCDDHLSYNLFRYNVGLAFSFKYGAFKTSIQANMGAIRYFGLSAYIYAPAVYNQMVMQLINNKTDFFVDPAAAIGFNFKYWGINLIWCYPWSTNDSKYIEHESTIGFNLNFKFNHCRTKQE